MIRGLSLLCGGQLAGLDKVGRQILALSFWAELDYGEEARMRVAADCKDTGMQKPNMKANKKMMGKLDKPVLAILQ